MPEAAEVGVAVGQLGLVAVGRVLDSLEVSHPRSTRAQPVGQLRRFVGHRVDSVRRHGKWIVIGFDDVAGALGIHLRMSGQLLVPRTGAVPGDRHVHAVLELGSRQGRPTAASDVPGPPPGGAGVDGGATRVWFRDPRTFGELRDLADAVPVSPDLDDPAVTTATLLAASERRTVGVKAVLLDQKTGAVSGIGSYLADEALHAAGISPCLGANRVRPEAWARILDASRDIARRSAVVGGVTLPDEGWVDLWGRRGDFAAQLRVHGRRECLSCATATASAVVGGRRARWCPACQPE